LYSGWTLGITERSMLDISLYGCDHCFFRLVDSQLHTAQWQDGWFSGEVVFHRRMQTDTTAWDHISSSVSDIAMTRGDALISSVSVETIMDAGDTLFRQLCRPRNWVSQELATPSATTVTNEDVSWFRAFLSPVP
jgi:hypothetical protein